MHQKALSWLLIRTACLKPPWLKDLRMERHPSAPPLIDGIKTLFSNLHSPQTTFVQSSNTAVCFAVTSQVNGRACLSTISGEHQNNQARRPSSDNLDYTCHHTAMGQPNLSIKAVVTTFLTREGNGSPAALKKYHRVPYRIRFHPFYNERIQVFIHMHALKY